MKHQQTWGQCEEQISRYRENGMLTRDIIKALANIGKTISSDCNGMTINRFVKTHPRGSYYVLVRGHALAVVDGTVQDWTGDTAQRRKLQGYFDMRA